MSTAKMPASRIAGTGGGTGARRPLRRRVFGWPATGPGWWATGLWLSSIACLAGFAGFIAAGHRGGETFFSGSPWLYATMLPMFGLGIAGGAVAAWAVVRRGERSLLELLPFLWGLFWLFMLGGEIGGAIVGEH